jgi:hypothetical protein
MRFLSLCSFAIGALTACSGSSSGSIDNGTDSGAGGGDAAPAPDGGGAQDAHSDGATGASDTWSFVYANYIGPGTPGHCGNAGCHQHIQSGFMCGTSKDTCYNGLLAKGLIGTKSNPQLLVDPAGSPVIWFSSSGVMPQDNAVPNAAATRDVGAWVAAGAKND